MIAEAGSLGTPHPRCLLVPLQSVQDGGGDSHLQDGERGSEHSEGLVGDARGGRRAASLGHPAGQERPVGSCAQRGGYADGWPAGRPAGLLCPVPGCCTGTTQPCCQQAPAPTLGQFSCPTWASRWNHLLCAAPLFLPHECSVSSSGVCRSKRQRHQEAAGRVQLDSSR